VQKLEDTCAAHSEQVRHLTTAATQATQRAEAAETSVKSSHDSASASPVADSEGKAAELEALQGQMEGWLEDMRVLKELEQTAVKEAMTKAALLGEALSARDKAHASLEEAQKQVEELNAINSKLIGHSNAKQKVQHVVKMKEENNELHAGLKKAQSELGKMKDKASRLEKEVDKLRGALGVEGGADEVLAEEERHRTHLAAKEEQYKSLVNQMEGMMAKALTIAPGLGGAGEAAAVCATGEGDGAICERVERVLEVLAQRMQHDAAELLQSKNALKNREFENELLKKQLQLRGVRAPGADDAENQHPNSPSALRKTPGKGLSAFGSKTPSRAGTGEGQAKTPGGRRSAFATGN